MIMKVIIRIIGSAIGLIVALIGTVVMLAVCVVIVVLTIAFSPVMAIMVLCGKDVDDFSGLIADPLNWCFSRIALWWRVLFTNLYG
jgi:hypothetical protein